MRFSTIVMAYFTIAVVMWGGGAIDFEDSGMTKFMVSNGEDGVGANPTVRDQVEGIEGSSGLIGQLGGGLLLVWDFVVKVVGVAFWPYTGLAAVGAPPVVTAALGGPFVVAFLMALVRLIRRSG